MAPVWKPRKKAEKKEIVVPEIVYMPLVYDECEYLEALKSTIVRLRKEAKLNNENPEVTKIKIAAVRNHKRSEGICAGYRIGNLYGGILIRKK